MIRLRWQDGKAEELAWTSEPRKNYEELRIGRCSMHPSLNFVPLSFSHGDNYALHGTHYSNNVTNYFKKLRVKKLIRANGNLFQYFTDASKNIARSRTIQESPTEVGQK